MNSFQIEAWARTVIDRVILGKPNEDARVELNWYDQVQSQFDEFIAPTLKDLNMSYEGKTVVALLFDTERFPFVIKVSDGRLEIPWREGTRTRSARRSDLFKLLIPVQSLPRVEVLSGNVSLQRDNQGEHHWNVSLDFYVEPQSGALVIPFHRCEAKLEIPQLGYTIPLDGLRLYPPSFGFPTNSRTDSVTMTSTSSELLVQGPGRAKFAAHTTSSDLPTDLGADLQITLRLLPVGAEYPVLVSIRFFQSPISPKESYIVKTWVYKTDSQ